MSGKGYMTKPMMPLIGIIFVYTAMFYAQWCILNMIIAIYTQYG